MSHLHNSNDGTIKVSMRTVGKVFLTIDLTNLSLGKLTNLCRLRDGLGAEICESWTVAGPAAIKAVSLYLGGDLFVESFLDGFTIKVTVNDPVNTVTREIVRFFEREGIFLEDITMGSPRRGVDDLVRYSDVPLD